MDSFSIISISEEEINEHMDYIMKKSKIKQNELLEPTSDKKEAVYNIVMNFISDKKRKIYGGFALNQLFINKDKKQAIYDELLNEPDVDFYSPEPLKDLKELANLLLEAGFGPIFSKEAQHADTFKIYANLDKECCDITFVPNNIYKNIRFVEIGDIRYTHPYFLMIDKLRVFTDPLISYRILEKELKRFRVLEKLYPLPYIKEQLIIEKYKNTKINSLLNEIFVECLLKSETLIFTGIYMFNYYLHHIKQLKIKNNDLEYINIPYYELYSTDYINDGEFIINFIKENKNLEYVEFYPFFQYYGYSMCVYYINDKKKIPILYLYSNNERCIPTKKSNAILFDGNENKILETPINLSSFDFAVLHTLINMLKVRVDGNNDLNDRLYKFLNGITKMRKNYFDQTKKNLITDDTLFQSFFSECMGKTIQPERKKRINSKIKRDEKKFVEFRYDPECPNKKTVNYYFNNISGCIIENEKDKFLLNGKKKLDIEEKFKRLINKKKNISQKKLCEIDNAEEIEIEEEYSV